MRELYKKLAAALCAMMLLCGQLLGGVYVSASMPPTYDFDTWTGRGEVSVRVPHRNADKFLRLVCDLELIYNNEQVEVSPTSYTVTADGHDTIVTFKEEYLQTLADGTYNFTCYFSGKGEEFEMFGERAYSPDPFGIELPNMTANYTLKRISYNGKDIDPSNYTVTTDKGYPKIVFKEGISIGSSFMCYFTAEYVTEWTSLQVDRQVQPVEETTAPPAASSEETETTAEAVAGGESNAPVSNENLTSVSSAGSVTSDAEASHPALSTQIGSGGENVNAAVAVMVAAIAVGAVAGCAALGFVLLKRYRNKKADK